MTSWRTPAHKQHWARTTSGAQMKIRLESVDNMLQKLSFKMSASNYKFQFLTFTDKITARLFRETDLQHDDVIVRRWFIYTVSNYSVSNLQSNTSYLINHRMQCNFEIVLSSKLLLSQCLFTDNDVAIILPRPRRLNFQYRKHYRHRGASYYFYFNLYQGCSNCSYKRITVGSISYNFSAFLIARR